MNEVNSGSPKRVSVRLAPSELTPVPTCFGKDSAHWSFMTGRRFKQPKTTTHSIGYTLPNPWGKGKCPTFGHGKRWNPVSLRGKDSPPPNYYHIRTPLSRGPYISPTPRKASARSDTSPGPGSYKVPCTIGETQKWTFQGRSRSVTRTMPRPSSGR